MSKEYKGFILLHKRPSGECHRKIFTEGSILATLEERVKFSYRKGSETSDHKDMGQWSRDGTAPSVGKEEGETVLAGETV
jgi:hypothetical protein